MSTEKKVATAANRLPPGQQLVAAHKWPIIGEREPAAPPAQLEQLEITGQVHQPATFSLSQLNQLPQTTVTLDIHCVTRWSKYDVEFSGVLLTDLLATFELTDAANFISFVASSARDHSTSLQLQEALAHETLIALRANGEPLSREHGGPIRNIVPRKYFYKSVKWLKRIELLPEDRLGYWEAETGYHNGADPWREERYMAPSIDRRTAARLMSSKDFSDHDLRSIDASRRSLDGLTAVNALLRDAKFENSSLQRADFTAANLSNAHLRGADLRNALFVGTDLEGADLAGADLRGADFSGCSLIGSSFCDIDPETGAETHPATIDQTTVISVDSLAPLTESQADFVTRQIGLPR